MAITAGLVGAGVALVGTGVGVREAQLSRQSAEEAMVPQVPAPQQPLGATSSTAQNVQSANMQAQTAGASLLSDPTQNANQGRQIGTQPGATGKSLLGG